MDDKIVQIRLSDAEYQKIEFVMRRKKMSLEEAVREAVMEWVRIQIQLEEDPLFSLKQKSTGIATDSGSLDKGLSEE